MSNNQMKRARASMDRAMKDFHSSPPEGLSPEEQSRWKNVMKASHASRDTASALSARVIAENPGLYEKFKEMHRETVLKQMSENLAGCSKLLDLDPETLQVLLNIPIDEMSGLARAASALQTSTEVALTVQEAKIVADQAAVISVMEEKVDEDDYKMDSAAAYPLPGISY